MLWPNIPPPPVYREFTMFRTKTLEQVAFGIIGIRRSLAIQMAWCLDQDSPDEGPSEEFCSNLEAAYCESEGYNFRDVLEKVAEIDNNR